MTQTNQKQQKLIKICGLKTPTEAKAAINNGANLLGVIMVPNRKRTIDPEEALKISQLCQEARLSRGITTTSKDLLNKVIRSNTATTSKPSEWFTNTIQEVISNGPFLVGVFRNQSIAEINDSVAKLRLDMVQLHGTEDIEEYASEITVPVIPRFVLADSTRLQLALRTGLFVAPLLDSEAGGEGKVIDWDAAANTLGKELGGVFILAGGLKPENVAAALNVKGCVGVDVSGGVETDGKKDLSKIKLFLENGRNGQ
ncbi:unnamed protein product [Ambrosiozyma monospora]|uniref:N-(5'-phosphoribosyl)anthranilate isomerase n=1 Tax=Ambrosiozyma monospora TaxID=43982 RepID=A0A9W6YW83_AMBMO|nr:unnamed protein product [Ambrosiozyma monospora]